MIPAEAFPAHAGLNRVADPLRIGRARVPRTRGAEPLGLAADSRGIGGGFAWHSR
jgi:hypothetical protein